MTAISVVAALLLVAIVAAAVAAGSAGAAMILAPLFLILELALLYPALAVMVKRLHDRNRPGWWAAFIFVPAILGSVVNAFNGGDESPLSIALGGVVVIVSIWFLIELGFLCGTVGANRYGPDPLGT
jgi:uncharacterized membrane protein YhaH (DUF805 family)